jgi:ribosomal protein S18 acetylase RimI-like enzyme
MVDQIAVRIREASESDLRSLEWEGRYTHFRRLYRRAMDEAKQGRRILLVAEVDYQVVGQIFIQLQSRRAELADGGYSGYLYSFRVRPNYRNRGIGSMLLTAAEDELRQRAFKRAVIAVAKKNERARSLYESHGYQFMADDPGKWSYIDHEGNLRHVSEPADIMQKLL